MESCLCGVVSEGSFVSLVSRGITALPYIIYTLRCTLIGYRCGAPTHSMNDESHAARRAAFNRVDLV